MVKTGFGRVRPGRASSGGREARGRSWRRLVIVPMLLALLTAACEDVAYPERAPVDESGQPGPEEAAAPTPSRNDGEQRADDGNKSDGDKPDGNKSDEADSDETGAEDDSTSNNEGTNDDGDDDERTTRPADPDASEDSATDRPPTPGLPVADAGDDTVSAPLPVAGDPKPGATTPAVRHRHRHRHRHRPTSRQLHRRSERTKVTFPRS